MPLPCHVAVWQAERGWSASQQLPAFELFWAEVEHIYVPCKVDLRAALIRRFTICCYLFYRNAAVASGATEHVLPRPCRLARMTSTEHMAQATQWLLSQTPRWSPTPRFTKTRRLRDVCDPTDPALHKCPPDSLSALHFTINHDFAA